MPGITERAQDNATRRQNTQPGNRSVIQRNAKPSFGRELKSSETTNCRIVYLPNIWLTNKLPANKVANHVGVADNQRVGVFLLAGLGSMEVLPEASLNASSILEELLQHIQTIILEINEQF